jgi:FkbM family methyltransferase
MGCVLGDVKKWFADNGDVAHRLNYPLSKESLVIDLGAYDGKWAEKVIKKFQCRVIAFEPVKSFYQQATALLSCYPTATVYNYGLGSSTQDLRICLSADGTSLYGEIGEKEIIKIKEIKTELEALKISFVDLLKVNIEGAEYPLFEHLLAQKMQTMFKDIQIQFHILDDESSVKREAIRRELAKTHMLTYDYPFVWENWRLK